MGEYAIMAMAMLGTGVIGGILAGLLGVGGGIVVVPVLEFVLGMMGVPLEIRMHIAVGTSLAVIIPTSISSARAHHARGAVDIELAKCWAVFILFGAVIGVVIASQVGGAVLSAIFGLVALLVAIKMAMPLDERTLINAVPGGLLTGLIPATIGAISTMMGIGGGTLTVPALTLMNTPIHRAVGTSSLFGLLISIPGAIGFVIAGWGNALLPAGSLGFVSLIGFALIAPVTVLAAPLGARIAHALDRRRLSLLFGLFLLVVAARMLYRAWHG
jgi:uncharacterized membrane protein YfcA